jgi:hypothetical protein
MHDLDDLYTLLGEIGAQQRPVGQSDGAGPVPANQETADQAGSVANTLTDLGCGTDRPAGQLPALVVDRDDG